jgi:hypothetical protein
VGFRRSYWASLGGQIQFSLLLSGFRPDPKVLAKETMGKVSNLTKACLRVSPKLHRLIRGLRWAVARDGSATIKLLRPVKLDPHNTHNKVPSKFLQSCSILPLSPSRPRPTGGVNLHTSNKQTRLALSGYFIMVAKGCGSVPEGIPHN